ncbi:MAG: tetratricopeptide repeat protein [Methylophagaceae bacterium]
MKLTKIVLAIAALLSTSAFADLLQDVDQLQKRWAQVNYELKGNAQKEAFEALSEQAAKVTRTYPDAAESWIWQGIINSSYAGAKGGLGAMSYAKSSKADLEKAMAINDSAMLGSAYISLGTLYFKVPGWPIGFGDDDKAKQLLEKALTLNPDGIDSNYFYGEFLANQRQYQQAETYLLKAQQAPARPNRPLADKGRQNEILISLQKIKAHSKPKNNANFTH